MLRTPTNKDKKELLKCLTKQVKSGKISKTDGNMILGLAISDMVGGMMMVRTEISKHNLDRWQFPNATYYIQPANYFK